VIETGSQPGNLDRQAFDASSGKFLSFLPPPDELAASFRFVRRRAVYSKHPLLTKRMGAALAILAVFAGIGVTLMLMMLLRPLASRSSFRSVTWPTGASRSAFASNRALTSVYRSENDFCESRRKDG
jgi:hypothetical protein